MENGKSLGLDGFPCDFYKVIWDMVGDEFRSFSTGTFSYRDLIESLNQGLIKLISKNVSRDFVEVCSVEIM